MRRFLLLSLACLTLVLLAGLGQSQNANDPYAGHIAATDPRSPAEEKKLFHLPPGFEAQLVAAEPQIQKPLNLAFDDRGRLWVTDTVEYPYAAPADRKPRDTVKILDDLGEDGRARKVTTFADGLNIPIGVLPLGESALVYSVGSILRVTDSDGDGQADRREVVYQSYGHRDTHGMTSAFTIGFDGWVYACHGFSNSSTVRAADGTSITMQSGNTYRMKIDGSRVEQFTHGQVNPFGLTFDPLGNLYSVDCHTRPVMMLLRGGYYQSFGKPDDGLGFAPEMCDHDHGSTANSGITYYAADHFPPEYRDTIFTGNVVTWRINHDRLQRHGSSYVAIEQPDFLKSDDPWFRPVDIKLGPDGALYVADFYNRIIGHYEVPLNHPGRDRDRGRIWRIVYRGLDGKGKPVSPRSDWTKATITELVQDLGHPNLTVRMKATNQLVTRGPNAVEAVRGVMRPGSKPFQRVHGLWVLERRGALDYETLAAAADDTEPAVRTHVRRVLAERHTLSPPERQLVLKGLKDADDFVRRAAADALGQHPSAENIRPLLNLRTAVSADDFELMHTVRMALRNQLRTGPVWAQLPLTPWSDADERALADVAPGVPRAEAAAFLLKHVPRLPENRETLTRYVHHIARYGNGDAAEVLLKFVRGNQNGDLNQQFALFKALSQGTQERGGKLSDDARTWAAELTDQLLHAKPAEQVQAGIELAGALKLEKMEPRLFEIATVHQPAEPQRLAALNALVAIDPKKAIDVLGKLLADAAESPTLRDETAKLLGQINKPEAQEELLKVLPTAPARLQGSIAVALAATKTGAEKLLEAVQTGKASARLLQERPVEVRLNESKVPDLKERLAKLTQGLPAADQRLQQLQAGRRDGFARAKTDLEAGAKIFEKNCAICHQIGGKGAKIGPQLDGVGIRGVDRLLEDILDPNRNVDQAFRQTTLELKNGQFVYGLLLKEEGEVLVLADNQGKEVRVPGNTVAERSISPLSPMPANFVDQVSEADFYNLIAWLLTQQPVRETKDGTTPKR
jgi:putative heme-binding domain-containing protein